MANAKYGLKWRTRSAHGTLRDGTILDNGTFGFVPRLDIGFVGEQSSCFNFSEPEREFSSASSGETPGRLLDHIRSCAQKGVRARG